MLDEDIRQGAGGPETWLADLVSGGGKRPVPARRNEPLDQREHHHAGSAARGRRLWGEMTAYGTKQTFQPM